MIAHLNTKSRYGYIIQQFEHDQICVFKFSKVTHLVQWKVTGNEGAWLDEGPMDLVCSPGSSLKIWWDFPARTAQLLYCPLDKAIQAEKREAVEALADIARSLA